MGLDQVQQGDPDHTVSGERPLRIIGAALALVAGAIHIALSVTDLIPGEATRGPAFLAMGIGYFGCAALLFARQMELHVLIAVYALSLIGAYAFTRASMPVEAIGLASKAAELGLAAVAIVLARRPVRARTAATGTRE
ncbi:hypothetical protein BH18CHL2_BH18CHL2_00940 [soil metagenome]